MKKKIVVYVLMAFIALFLIFRFVSISNNISLQRGIVRSVSATEHNDIVIELENDSFYYINRGMESEINYHMASYGEGNTMHVGGVYSK